jgi:hypothetical protein
VDTGIIAGIALIAIDVRALAGSLGALSSDGRTPIASPSRGRDKRSRAREIKRGQSIARPTAFTIVNELDDTRTTCDAVDSSWTKRVGCGLLIRMNRNAPSAARTRTMNAIATDYAEAAASKRNVITPT